MSHAHLLVRRLVGGALGVLLPTACAHAQMFDTVSSVLSVQVSSQMIETTRTFDFPEHLKGTPARRSWLS